MKILSKLIVAVAILSLSSLANAQYIALKGGLNLSNMVNKDNDQTFSSDYSNRAGFHAGVVAGIRAGFIGVEGGLLVASRGFNFENTTVNDNGDIIQKTAGNLNSVYLDIPINLKLSAGVGSHRVFATVGPIIGFGIGGKSTTETTLNYGTPDETTEESKDKIKWGSDTDDDIKAMDVGIGVGGGIDLGNISLSATYNWGLVNLAPDSGNGRELKNNFLQFSLGFKIFGRR